MNCRGSSPFRQGIQGSVHWGSPKQSSQPGNCEIQTGRTSIAWLPCTKNLALFIISMFQEKLKTAINFGLLDCLHENEGKYSKETVQDAMESQLMNGLEQKAGDGTLGLANAGHRDEAAQRRANGNKEKSSLFSYQTREPERHSQICSQVFIPPTTHDVPMKQRPLASFMTSPLPHAPLTFVVFL